MLLTTELKTPQPPLNLTQILGSLIMEIQTFLVVNMLVVNNSIIKFVQVS